MDTFSAKAGSDSGVHHSHLIASTYFASPWTTGAIVMVAGGGTTSGIVFRMSDATGDVAGDCRHAAATQGPAMISKRS